MLEALDLCGCSCGIRTKRLSAIASWLYAAILNRLIVNWAEELACGPLARQASGSACSRSISCLSCATSQTGPGSRSALCLQPSKDGSYVQHPHMLQSLYGHCIVEVQCAWNSAAGWGPLAQPKLGWGKDASKNLFVWPLLPWPLQPALVRFPVSRCWVLRHPHSQFVLYQWRYITLGIHTGSAVLVSRQSFCAANGLTISIPKTKVALFGQGHHDCAWKVAGQDLKCSQSFTYQGMLFHEDEKIKQFTAAVQARFIRSCASVTSVGSIFSRYYNLQCANLEQLLVRLQQATLQPQAGFAAAVPQYTRLVWLWSLACSQCTPSRAPVSAALLSGRFFKNLYRVENQATTLQWP